MNNSLFQRLAIAAVVLIFATLLAMNYAMGGLGNHAGPAVDDGVRRTVLIIALASALVALLVAAVISHSLANRVNRLKRLADGMLRTAAGSEAENALISTTNPSAPRRNISGLDRLDLNNPGDDLDSLERSLSGVATEMRALVDSLRFESARREAILSGMAEGVLAVDRESRVTFCNEAFLRAIGFRGERYEGLSLLEMVRDPAMHDLIRGTLTTGVSGTSRFKLSADTPRTFEAQSTPLAMASGRGAIAIFHDITDLERLEQVRKDFVANVSHELRTPLSGIIGYADTLIEGALDDAANRRKFVEIIRTNAIRLGSIASDLLVLSELESGAEPIEAETVSVRGVLEAALVTVEAEARAREVKLVREKIEDLYVDGSRLRLEQALLNLIANAIKFNRPGGEVRVGVASRPGRGGGRIAITVADTGVGIPSQDLPRIFERFYRVDKARSRQVGGTGLGLSIVKHVVERMNGTVHVESQLGKGSTFTILVPAAQPASIRLRA